MPPVPDHAARVQATIFVDEFEAMADSLVAELDDLPPRSPQRHQLTADLYEVRRHIAQLQHTFGLPPVRGTSA
ncbi:hypothetical protein ABLE92_23090 [Gordonia sp. VNQ95]|uniref:hypothetical protein n=1 Tax=Gordonia TaxID=2053 RepID=UPI0032B3CD68